MSKNKLRTRRSVLVAIVFGVLLVLGFNPDFLTDKQPFDTPDTATKIDAFPDVLSESTETGAYATDVLGTLQVKGRAPKSGYSRDEFSSSWATIGDCDVRNEILQASLQDLRLSEDGCIVLSGVLLDPYTGKVIEFNRGSTTSDAVQIDHVVALSDAWQKGAQELDTFTRLLFANDALNLLAVDGPTNQQKGDKDAASWLPPNRSYRCRYVARQIAVKAKYVLWVSEAEKAAMQRVLNGCGGQRVPLEE